MSFIARLKEYFFLTSTSEQSSPKELGRTETPFDDFVVIDVETTGLNPYKDKIIQISAVRYLNHREIGHFVTYINPLTPIPKRASDINGITHKTVQGKPTFAEAQKRYFDFIGKSKIIVGYNVKFDLKFISSESGIDVFDRWAYFDVLEYTRNAIPNLPDYKLSTVSKYIGYNTSFHDALADCRACGEVLNFLCEKDPSLRSFDALQQSSKCISPALLQIEAEIEQKIKSEKAEKRLAFEQKKKICSWDDVDDSSAKCFIVRGGPVLEDCLENADEIVSTIEEICLSHSGRCYKTAAKSAKAAILLCPEMQNESLAAYWRKEGYRVLSPADFLSYWGKTDVLTQSRMDEVRQKYFKSLEESMCF